MSFDDGPGRMELGDTVELMTITEFDAAEPRNGTNVMRTYKSVSLDVFGDYVEVQVPRLSLVEAPLTRADFDIIPDRHLSSKQEMYLIEVVAMVMGTRYGWF